MLSLRFLAARLQRHPSGNESIASGSTQFVSNTSIDPPYRLKLSTVSHTGTPQPIEVPVYEQAQIPIPACQR